MPQAKERFPHMYGAEAEIWRRWLARHRGGFDRFQYDTHVGRLWPEHENLDREWKVGAASVYQKRIDVVGFQTGVITIFEVKPHAGLGAIGQILGYVSLYEEQFNPSEEMRAAIVAELVDPNIRKLLEQFGIDLYVI